jgi:hypothetical protein
LPIAIGDSVVRMIRSVDRSNSMTYSDTFTTGC